MINILVTGNGFDLEHKIPSQYKHFLGFVDTFLTFYNYKDNSFKSADAFQKQIEEISSNYIDIVREINNNESLGNAVIQEFHEMIFENVWLKYFQSYLKKVSKDGAEYNWIDIEEEISDVIKKMTEVDDSVFLKKVSIGNDVCSSDIGKSRAEWLVNFMGYKDVKSRIFYINKIGVNNFHKAEKGWLFFRKRLSDDFGRMIRSLEIYLSFFVDMNKIHTRSLFNKIKFRRVITFNYTNTYKKLYGQEAIPCDFIHGTADYKRMKEDNNMVIGIDEFLPDKIKDTHLAFIEYRKYYQRIVKKCDFEYRKALMQWGDDIITWFFGHSLAVSDREMLIHLLPGQGKERIAKTYVCYHDDRMFKQQVTNLVRILGQDSLNELVCGAYPKIVFIDQKDMGLEFDLLE